MKLHALKCSLAIAVLSALPLAAQAVPAAAKPAALAKSEFHPKTIAWAPQFAYRSASLRIAGPSGVVFDRDFGQDKPVFDLAATPYLADGQYVYEIVLGRMPDEALAKALSRAEFNEDGSVSDAGLAAKLGALRETVSGTFTISNGLIVSPYLVESPLRKGLANEKDIIHADDVIINGGSLCVGFDCINGETFGFRTILLKENNTRIGFTDTSVGTFPANSWQLTANDSASGGANKFSIEDITGVKVPFTVTAGAATNSLFIDSTGRVGFRTGTPVLDLHARTSNTPGLRLEQDNSGGFTAQTWDIAGNEANFFVRDVTGGSRLPFRIRPGAPTSSLDIAASGNVGIGNSTPTSKLDVRSGAFGNNQSFGISLGTPSSPNGWLAGFKIKSDAFGVPRVAIESMADATFGLTEAISISSTGLVGIGTVPAVRLDVRNANATTSFSGDVTYAAGFGNLSGKRVAIGYDETGEDIGVISAVHSQVAWKPLAINPNGGNVGIGTVNPTHKLHVVGNSKIEGTLQITGGTIIPDYVFEPGFKLASIEENAAYMWKHRHLPAVGAAKTTDDGKSVVDVFAHTVGILEELEKAHIYIEQLHREITALKAQATKKDGDLRAEIDAIRALVEARRGAEAAAR